MSWWTDTLGAEWGAYVAAVVGCYVVLQCAAVAAALLWSVVETV